jgi:putative spermidine/putrescine transport system ATP-binding protein
MIRPESISVGAPANANLTGQVERVSFVGDRQRLTVSNATERPLLIDAPNTIEVKIGERIGLTVDPRAIRLLPGERP